MADINPRWRVQLEGLPEDIDLLEELLFNSMRNIDDYFIARMNGVVVLESLELGPPDAEPEPPREAIPRFNVPVLTSLKWDTLSTHDQVIEKATAVLRILSGCLKLLTVSESISIGTVYEVMSDGRVQSTRDTKLTIRIRPKKEDYPSPADFRKAVNLTDHVDFLGDILAMYAEEPDWFAIYKMIEGIENHLGGEKAMRASPYLEGAELKRAKQTANAVRHLDNSIHRPPPSPIALNDAQGLMRRSITALLKELTKTSA